jgi:YgiT-type zinc finger domain-containing protein
VWSDGGCNREVTRSFGRGPSLLVIEVILLWSCPHCEESYFTAQTLHEIERIKTLRKSLALSGGYRWRHSKDWVPNTTLHRIAGGGGSC